MVSFVRSLKNNALSKKKYNFRVADSKISDRLSGFEHNAVTPIGFRDSSVPVIMDEKITKLEYVWLGGGEVDVKWAVSTKDFIRVFKPFVGPISNFNA